MGRPPKTLKTFVLERDKHRCVLCGGKGEHIYRLDPSSNKASDIITVCEACYSRLMRKRIRHRRTTVTVTLPPDIVRWVDDRIEEGVFYSKSHAVEQGLKLLILYHQRGYLQAIKE